MEFKRKAEVKCRRLGIAILGIETDWREQHGFFTQREVLCFFNCLPWLQLRMNLLQILRE